MPMRADGFLQILLSSGLFSVLTEVLTLLKKAAAYLEQHRLQGIYEVLEQRRTITIQDPCGYRVAVDTTQRVRFRQNHVAALVDYVWGDGEILAAYRCSPGVPVDVYKEGSRQVVLISLREQKCYGDELLLETHRQIVGGFTRAVECWEADVYHRTQSLELTILFPRERKCRRATLTRQNAGRTVALGGEHFSLLPDGRQRLHWAIRRPQLHERYRLHWEW